MDLKAIFEKIEQISDALEKPVNRATHEILANFYPDDSPDIDQCEEDGNRRITYYALVTGNYKVANFLINEGARLNNLVDDLVQDPPSVVIREHGEIANPLFIAAGLENEALNALIVSRGVKTEVTEKILVDSGFANIEEGKFSAGINNFNDAIHLNSKNAAAHLGLGTVHYLQGKVQEAFTALLKAVDLDLDPIEAAQAYLKLGNLYRKQENFTEAASAYQNAIKLDPSLKEQITPDLEMAIKRSRKSIEERLDACYPEGRPKDLEIPQGFKDPVTWEIMTNPTQINCGHSLELETLINLQKAHDAKPESDNKPKGPCCPSCRKLIPLGNIKEPVTNWGLNSVIDDFIVKHETSAKLLRAQTTISTAQEQKKDPAISHSTSSQTSTLASSPTLFATTVGQAEQEDRSAQPDPTPSSSPRKGT